MFGLFKNIGKSIGESVGESVGETAATTAIDTVFRLLNERGIWLAHEREIKPECLAEVKRRAAAMGPR